MFSPLSPRQPGATSEVGARTRSRASIHSSPSLMSFHASSMRSSLMASRTLLSLSSGMFSVIFSCQFESFGPGWARGTCRVGDTPCTACRSGVRGRGTATARPGESNTTRARVKRFPECGAPERCFDVVAAPKRYSTSPYKQGIFFMAGDSANRFKSIKT